MHLVEGQYLSFDLFGNGKRFNLFRNGKRSGLFGNRKGIDGREVATAVERRTGDEEGYSAAVGGVVLTGGGIRE